MILSLIHIYRCIRDRPYFARSISDFWHRWHITLGTWMKDYVFYPFSLSKGMNRFSKYCKKNLGRHAGRVLPVCIANQMCIRDRPQGSA